MEKKKTFQTFGKRIKQPIELQENIFQNLAVAFLVFIQ